LADWRTVTPKTSFPTLNRWLFCYLLLRKLSDLLKPNDQSQKNNLESSLTLLQVLGQISNVGGSYYFFGLPLNLPQCNQTRGLLLMVVNFEKVLNFCQKANFLLLKCGKKFTTQHFFYHIAILFPPWRSKHPFAQL
jgi:hypothetical protein